MEEQNGACERYCGRTCCCHGSLAGEAKDNGTEVEETEITTKLANLSRIIPLDAFSDSDGVCPCEEMIKFLRLAKGDVELAACLFMEAKPTLLQGYKYETNDTWEGKRAFDRYINKCNYEVKVYNSILKNDLEAGNAEFPDLLLSKDRILLDTEALFSLGSREADHTSSVDWNPLSLPKENLELNRMWLTEQSCGLVCSEAPSTKILPILKTQLQQDQECQEHQKPSSKSIPETSKGMAVSKHLLASASGQTNLPLVSLPTKVYADQFINNLTKSRFSMLSQPCQVLELPELEVGSQKDKDEPFKISLYWFARYSKFFPMSTLAME
ncbi:unnamed protein product [Protopolystoma xenopodis]|uniref:Uncharacterized protein n=1 Tax=Protopolystoma xenopodis TaxID=117903 RepID=A0A448WDS8_9PLAT|nr:unnamed protein product [Protopolystoma xenopodis]